MGLELRVIISANINSAIAVIFEPKFESLRPSEAEIQFFSFRDRAGKNGRGQRPNGQVEKSLPKFFSLIGPF